MELNSILAVDNFFPEAESLKAEYLRKFSEPLKATEERFVWDYWHVPDQYTLHRTLATQYFSEELYEDFEAALCAWGQENLGCSEISTPWLSYYLDGCEQRLHADNPHGPWAFVFSLTDWKNRVFTGGETQVLSERLLDYWTNTEFSEGIEAPQIIDSVAPEFNRLLVFDPRRPHGVNRVDGVRDPRKARLVMHGWFLEPQPFLTGGLEEHDLGEPIGEALGAALDKIEAEGTYNGYLHYHIVIEASGRVETVKQTVNTLRALEHRSAPIFTVAENLKKALQAIVFPESSMSSDLYLPVIFR